MNSRLPIEPSTLRPTYEPYPCLRGWASSSALTSPGSATRVIRRSRVVSTGSPVDPVVSTSSTVDPVVSTSSTVDPVVSTGSTVDPVVSTGSTVDPVGSTGSTDDEWALGVARCRAATHRHDATTGGQGQDHHTRSDQEPGVRRGGRGVARRRLNGAGERVARGDGRGV